MNQSKIEDPNAEWKITYYLTSSHRILFWTGQAPAAKLAEHFSFMAIVGEGYNPKYLKRVRTERIN